MNKLNLDKNKIKECRIIADKIAKDVQDFIDIHSTVSVERTVLRLLGIDGIDEFGVPIPNKLVDDVINNGDISLGISYYIASALKDTGLSLDQFIHSYLNNNKTICKYQLVNRNEVDNILKPYYEKNLRKI